MRRWTVVRTIGLATAAVVAVGVLYELPASPLSRHGDLGRHVVPASVQTTAPALESPAVPPRRPTKPVVPAEVISYPNAGSQSYAVLPANPAVIGRGGKLMTFQIAIEGGITGVDKTAFAQFVRTTYGAAQGWASQGKWRFEQVGPGATPDFRLMLVTPQTRDVICGGGPDRYTSCRIGDSVVLNVARWAHGVPNFGASLTTYRQYMVNHETGHRLGNGHELCPGPGRPAPVMQQQTLGLHGCTAYAWPYLNGTRYSGRLGQYNDRVPHT